MLNFTLAGGQIWNRDRVGPTMLVMSSTWVLTRCARERARTCARTHARAHAHGHARAGARAHACIRARTRARTRRCVPVRMRMRVNYGSRPGGVAAPASWRRRRSPA